MGSTASAGRSLARASSRLADPEAFVISAAKLKTRNCVVATLSLKNILMASPLVDWAGLAAVTSRTDREVVRDAASRTLPVRFYRALLPP